LRDRSGSAREPSGSDEVVLDERLLVSRLECDLLVIRFLARIGDSVPSSITLLENRSLTILAVLIAQFS